MYQCCIQHMTMESARMKKYTGTEEEGKQKKMNNEKSKVGMK